MRPAKPVERIVLAMLAVLGIAAAAAAGTVLPPDPSRTVGNRVSFDGFADENGRAFSALVPQAELARDPRPWVVSPMYTRCPHTCSALTAGLRRALEQSGLGASEYRVLSFSFDPEETGAGLRGLREKSALPAEWLTLRALQPESLERTLASLDFRTIARGDGDFDHPNLVAVLAPDMRLATYLFGVTLSPSELARSVRRARDGVSAVDSWGTYGFVISAVGFSASALAFAWLLGRRRARRGGVPGS